MADERITGFLLVEVGQGDVDAVAAQLRTLDGVAFAHALLGPTDAIAYVETPTWESFNRLLNEPIRALITSGTVKRVETCLAPKPRDGDFGGHPASPPRGSAWIFVDVDMGEPEAVIRKLEEIDGVASAHGVIGFCDIIAYLECHDWAELRSILDSEIRTLPEVVRTDTRPILMRRTRGRRGAE